MTHTPGPWHWTASGAGPEDEYGCRTRGEINPTLFESRGFYGNPELFGQSENAVISAGSGEYTPYTNPADALLIAAAPELLAALQSLADAYDSLLDAYGKPHGWGKIESENARAAIARAT